MSSDPGARRPQELVRGRRSSELTVRAAAIIALFSVAGKEFPGRETRRNYNEAQSNQILETARQACAAFQLETVKLLL